MSSDQTSPENQGHAVPSVSPQLVSETLNAINMDPSFQLCPQNISVPVQFIKSELPSPSSQPLMELSAHYAPHAVTSQEHNVHSSEFQTPIHDSFPIVSWATDTSQDTCASYSIGGSPLPEIQQSSPVNFMAPFSQAMTSQINGQMVPELFNIGKAPKEESKLQKSKPKRKRVINKDQRSAANVRERRRMVTLNDAFDVLKQRIPTFSHEKKLSRIETLRLAMAYISFMKQLVNGKEPHDVTVDLPCFLNNPKPEAYKASGYIMKDQGPVINMNTDASYFFSENHAMVPNMYHPQQYMPQ